jgi:putative phage-type endonuclease
MINREQWLKERKTYIGGSDLGSIAGVNKYKSALDVYLDKTGDSIEEITNEKCYWGNRLESVVADEYAKRTGNQVVEPIGLIRHSEYPFIACNIDRFVNGGEYILECKTAGLMMADKWGIEGTAEIPDSYKCQVAYYAAIVDVPKVDIAVLIGGQEFRIYTYTRDKDLENKLIQVAVNFWNNHVLPKIPPEPSSASDISNLYPESNGLEVKADTGLLENVDKLKSLKEQEADIKNQTIILQDSIKQYMKDNEVLVDDSGNVFVTWKTGKARQTLDAKKLQQEHQTIYQQYLYECKAPRTLRIK